MEENKEITAQKKHSPRRDALRPGRDKNNNGVIENLTRYLTNTILNEIVLKRFYNNNLSP